MNNTETITSIFSHGFSSVFFCIFHFFFDTPEVTKIVLPKGLQNFKKTPNCTRWPKKLKQKGFPRNIQHTIPDDTKGSPPLSFLRHCEIFFREKNSLKGPPSIFWSFATESMLKNTKGSPLSVFRHCGSFFPKFFFPPKGPPFNFFDILQQIGFLKSQRVPPFRFFGIVRRFLKIFFS